MTAYALAAFMVVGGAALGKAVIESIASGPNYCAIVKVAKCSATVGGDWVLVTSGNNVYVVLMHGDKSVEVRQIQ